MTAGVLIGFLLIGCGAASPSARPAPTAFVSGPNARTDAFGNAEVSFDVDAAGVSGPFTVTTGRYRVSASVDAGTDGCTFFLMLETARDGPAIQSTTALVRADGGVASAEWSLTAGTYIVQEDETGLLNCQRPFTARITALN